MNPSPTTEERIWSVFSHLSALAFGMGLVLPVIGWSEQRTKSRYATFQCLQAFGYQSLGYTVWLVSYIVVLLLLLIVVIVSSYFGTKNGSSSSTLSVIWSGLFLLSFFGLLAVYLLLPVIAAVACAFGKDFRYPIMGTRLARYLGYASPHGTEEATPLNDEHQERWVAAMGHFSVIILFWGLLAPLTTWILQRRQNSFLRFQSIQATIYQAFVNVIYIGATMVSFAGMVPLFLWAGMQGNSRDNSTIFMAGPILFLLFLFLMFLVMLIIPLFHILGQWAGYRVLKGENYRYPMLGKLVEKRLAKS
jgi:uncharacterized Tic20 family protein